MGWMIAGAIIAFIVILMFFRVKLFVSFDGEFSYKFKYLFFTLRMKEREAGKAKKVPEKEPEEIDFLGLLGTLKKYSELLKNTAESALGRMRIDRLYIKLIIKQEDTAKTAILYGEACAVVYPAASFLGNKIGVKSYEIDIKPLFGEGEAAAEFEGIVSMRLGGILIVGISQSAAFIKSILKENRSKKTAKDGAVK
jgi:hypothetical protein